MLTPQSISSAQYAKFDMHAYNNHEAKIYEIRIYTYKITSLARDFNNSAIKQKSI